MKKKIISVVIAAAVLTGLIGCGGRQIQKPSADQSAATSAAAEAAEKEKTGNSAQAGGTQTPKENASSKSNTAQDPTQSAGSVTSSQPAAEQPITEQPVAEEPVEEEVKEKMLKMIIGDTEVSVDWESSDSVEALKDLCAEEPLVIQMSMYGGFEQVGSIGTRLPSDDEQTSTSAGDIVLYSSNQIVVFYGSNSWAYTRLGHITDQDAAGMTELLGNGDVTITISMEDAE